MSKSKKYIVYALIFSVCAIVFTILYLCNVIKTLDPMMTVIYVSYFAGLAMINTGCYKKDNDSYGVALSNYSLGFILVALSVGMLIYGLVTKQIQLF